MIIPGDTPPSLVRAGIWESVQEAHEHVLVMLAAGIDCSVHAVSGGYALFVLEEDARHALAELRQYSIEQRRNTPAAAASLVEHAAGIPWLAAWILLLSVVFLKQMADPSLTSRFSNSTTGLLVDGEWWRPLTALFFHGDLPHLLGNVLIGGIFCLMAAKSLGAGRSWPLILASGAVGNTINNLFHQGTPFASIGASTATFGALGILVGLAATATIHERRERFRSLLVPFLAGLVLFGMFGASGELTDVGGHVWGALSGLFFGAAAGWWQRTMASRDMAGGGLAHQHACACHSTRMG